MECAICRTNSLAPFAESAAMTLDQFMVAKKLSVRATARLLEVEPTQVHRWRHGTRLPNVREAERIRVITRGRVKATDW